MNDQYQQGHSNILENEPTPEEPLENQDTGLKTEIPNEKTEPWKTRVPAAAAPESMPDGKPGMLFGDAETQHFRSRWNEIQAKFVDEPGSSVREADGLVNELMKQYTEMIANQRRTLEAQWNRGDVSTEDLRQILQSYRTFFNRLLS
jgi:hypothetical protein